MVDELFPTPPGPALQVMVPKRGYQQLRLVQPRGVHRREAGTPPVATVGPVLLRLPGRVAGVTVLNQKDPFESAVPMAKGLQLSNVMCGVLLGLHRHFHTAGVDYKKQQQIHRPVTRVLELPLFDEARESPPNGVPLQHLVVRNLIHAPRSRCPDGPNARPGRSTKALSRPVL